MGQNQVMICQNHAIMGHDQAMVNACIIRLILAQCWYAMMSLQEEYQASSGTLLHVHSCILVGPMLTSLIARFMGPTWGPSGASRTQVGPMLAPWTLLSGMAQYRAYSSLAPSQWETALLHNEVFHWLGTSLESALTIWCDVTYKTIRQRS